VAARALGIGPFRGHIGEMTNALAGMPMVEVTAPDGSKELWAVASARHYAVGIVQKLVPPGHIARPSSSRVPMSEEMESLNWGEARRVKP